MTYGGASPEAEIGLPRQSSNQATLVMNQAAKRIDDQDVCFEQTGGVLLKFRTGQRVFQQGDVSDWLYYIVDGTVAVEVYSESGKEAVIDILGPGCFFGENSLFDNLKRSATVTATGACEIARLDPNAMRQLIDSAPRLLGLFLTRILQRNSKFQITLADHFFHNSEQRLARILWTLARIPAGADSSVIPIALNQEMLAHIVGTTRSRINQFMNKFRKMGCIDYDGTITVFRSLATMIREAEPDDETRIASLD